MRKVDTSVVGSQPKSLLMRLIEVISSIFLCGEALLIVGSIVVIFPKLSNTIIVGGMVAGEQDARQMGGGLDSVDEGGEGNVVYHLPPRRRMCGHAA